jgi:transcriptional regulator with XRE-family HTH domain
LARIDRSTYPEVIRAFRARVGLSQEELSRALGLGQNAVYRYEQRGAPAWVRYALLGMAVCDFGVPVGEARRLVAMRTRVPARR